MILIVLVSSVASTQACSTDTGDTSVTAKLRMTSDSRRGSSWVFWSGDRVNVVSWGIMTTQWVRAVYYRSVCLLSGGSDVVSRPVVLAICSSSHASCSKATSNARVAP